MKLWRTEYAPPSEPAIGLGSEGFRTAQLKEYRSEFSGALAKIIHDHLMRGQVRDCKPLDPEWTKWLLEAHAILSEVRSGSEMCPDLRV